MKHIIYLITFLSFLGCSNNYDEFITQTEPEDVELSHYLDAAIQAAYSTHEWMAEEGSCEYYDCCWEYVPIELRFKYENNEPLTVKEKEDIIAGLELSPSYLDTLDEYDEFYNLYCYRTYGKEYFIPWTDPDE